MAALSRVSAARFFRFDDRRNRLTEKEGTTMKRALISLALVLAVVGVLASREPGQTEGKLSRFMRPKLEHSKAVLEGLALENFGQIAKNAQALKELSEAAEWWVSPSVTY